MNACWCFIADCGSLLPIVMSKNRYIDPMAVVKGKAAMICALGAMDEWEGLLAYPILRPYLSYEPKSYSIRFVWRFEVGADFTSGCEDPVKQLNQPASDSSQVELDGLGARP